MKSSIKKLKRSVRGVSDETAKIFDDLSNGFIRSWHLATLSVVGYIFAALAIAESMLVEAGILILGFMLFDKVASSIDSLQKIEFGDIRRNLDSEIFRDLVIYAGLASFFFGANDNLGLIYTAIAAFAALAVFTLSNTRGTLPPISPGLRRVIIVPALLLSEPIAGAFIVALATSTALIEMLSRKA